MKKICRNPAATGNVFGVGDYQIHIVLTHQLRKTLMNDLPAGAADNVAQTQNP